MHTRSRGAAVSVTLVLAVGLIAVPTAGAMYVSGKQKVVNENAGKFKMTGDVKGKFKITKFHVKQTSPRLQGEGRGEVQRLRRRQQGRFVQR